MPNCNPVVGEAAALSPISWSKLVPSRAAVALKEVGRSRKRKRRRSPRRAAFTPAGQRGASTTNDRGRSSSGCFERVGLEGINEPACTVTVFATVTYFLTAFFAASIDGKSVEATRARLKFCYLVLA